MSFFTSRKAFMAAAAAMIVMPAIAGPAVAQSTATPQPPARDQLQRIHTPQSTDDALLRLTRDLELTPEQQRQVRPLLQQHHDKIQIVLDKNPAITSAVALIRGKADRACRGAGAVAYEGV